MTQVDVIGNTDADQVTKIQVNPSILGDHWGDFLLVVGGRDIEEVLDVNGLGSCR